MNLAPKISHMSRLCREVINLDFPNILQDITAFKPINNDVFFKFILDEEKIQI